MTTQNDGTEVSTQRAQFDSALRRILMRENLATLRTALGCR